MTRQELLNSLFIEQVNRELRATKIGHRGALERRQGELEAGEYTAVLADLDAAAALELLNMNEAQELFTAEELTELSAGLTKEHEEAGKLYMEGREGLAAVVRDYGVSTDATPEELTELNAGFLRFFGFSSAGSPNNFRHGGNGDLYYLSDRTKEELAAWLTEALEDLRENA